MTTHPAYTTCDGCGHGFDGIIALGATVKGQAKHFHGDACVSAYAALLAWYDADWVERNPGHPIPAPCGASALGGPCVLPPGHPEDHVSGGWYITLTEVAP